MKYLFCILFVLALYSSAQSVVLFEDVNESESIRIARQYPAVCQVKVNLAHEKSYGTGTLCYKGDGSGESFILTAAHVVKDAKPQEINVQFHDGGEYFVRNVNIMEDYTKHPQSYCDLATLFLEKSPKIPPMLVAPNWENLTSDPVLMIGYGQFGRYNRQGWGRYYTGSITKRAAEMKVRIHPRYHPKDSNFEGYGAWLKCHDESFSNLEGGVAPGDSGGPIVQNNKIYGVVSRSAFGQLLEDKTTKIYDVLPEDSLKKRLIKWDRKLNTDPKRRAIYRNVTRKVYHLPDFSVVDSQQITLFADYAMSWLENIQSSTSQVASYTKFQK